MSDATAPAPPHHRVRRMRGRDPHEIHRVATGLELMFDLTFAVAFGQAGHAFAHALAEGHIGAAAGGFAFATFAICWAWINFTWFASAYDTDDWVFRLITLVQMVGVLVLAVGLPSAVEALEHGGAPFNATMVLGYVVMRAAMIFQWLRAARQDPPRRRTCTTYATCITISQVGWIGLLFLPVPAAVSMALALALVAVEMAGPVLAERHGGTPWHAHHVAERYSLLAIIALGECVIGTITSLAAEVQHHGWSSEAGMVGFAGTALTFGMWWVYTLLPSAEVLHVDRRKSFVWGYGHMLVFGAIAGTGGGLHVVSYWIEGQAHVGPVTVVAAVVVPAAVFAASLGILYRWLLGPQPVHRYLAIASTAVCGLALALAAVGVPVPFCLLVLVLAPVVHIVGDEALGARKRHEALHRLQQQHAHRR